MASCKWAEFLYAAVPSRFFRDFLIRHHMDRCARCQARLIEAGEARALFVQSGDVKLSDRAFRRLAGEGGHGRRVRSGFRMEWAVGAATLFMTAVAGLWLLRGIQSAGPMNPAVAGPSPESIEIDRLSVGGLPAQAYIYRLKGSDTIFVWAAKTP